MDKIDKFLEKIGQLESSGGTNFDHKEIKSGIQRNTKAIGTFGLMPNTVKEIVKRTDSKDLNFLLKMNPDEKKELLESNPDLEYKLARQLASHVLEKQEGDEEKAAYSWFQGHNLSPERIEKKDYKNHPYVTKFRKLLESDFKPKKTYENRFDRYPVSTNAETNESAPLKLDEPSEEATKVKNYMTGSPTLDEVLNSYNTYKDEIKALQGSVMLTPFEETSTKFDPENLAASVGLSGIAKTTASKVAPLIENEARPVFERLKQSFGVKPSPTMGAQQQEEILTPLKQTKEYKEIFKDPYVYENTQLSPEDLQSGFDANLHIANTIRKSRLEKYLKERADRIKRDAKYIDQDTIPTE